MTHMTLIAYFLVVPLCSAFFLLLFNKKKCVICVIEWLEASYISSYRPDTFGQNASWKCHMCHMLNNFIYNIGLHTVSNLFTNEGNTKCPKTTKNLIFVL